MTNKIECGARICCRKRRNESNAKFAGWRARAFRKMPFSAFSDILGIQWNEGKKKHNFQNWQFARVVFSIISSFSLLYTWRRALTQFENIWVGSREQNASCARRIGSNDFCHLLYFILFALLLFEHRAELNICSTNYTHNYCLLLLLLLLRMRFLIFN